MVVPLVCLVKEIYKSIYQMGIRNQPKLHSRMCFTHLTWHLHLFQCPVLIEQGSPYSLKIISCIPEIQGLYCVINITTSHSHTANVAVKQISINKIHQRMGHISHEDLQCMVE